MYYKGSPCTLRQRVQNVNIRNDSKMDKEGEEVVEAVV